MKTKLLRKLRKQAFKMLKVEIDEDGLYCIRRNPQTVWYKRTKEKATYLKDGKTSNGAYKTWKFKTINFKDAVQRLVTERRKAILDMVVLIRIEQNAREKAEAQRNKNKQLRKI
jgi:hypothetical protein